MNERTDSDLLRASAETGSESAFAELVNRHVVLVHSVAPRVVLDPYLAEDATFTRELVMVDDDRAA